MPVTIQSGTVSTIATELLERWRDCPVAIAVDLGSDIGQVDPAIRPLNSPGRQARLFGRAVTASCEPPDFGAVLYAVDQIGPGDVLVIAASGNRETAMIGEILGGHVRRRGGAGIVCDGAIRDVATLSAWTDFAVYARFVTPRGPISAEKGRVNGTVRIGDCVVHPGDLVIGDDDGLAVLSPTALGERVADWEARLAREGDWQARLDEGQSVQSIFGLAPHLVP